MGKWRSLMFARSIRRTVVLSVVWLSTVATVVAQTEVPKPTDSYDELFQRYLQEAHSPKATPPNVQAWAWMSTLSLDRRARNVNDLITIRVVESITGSGTADSALSKGSS